MKRKEVTEDVCGISALREKVNVLKKLVGEKDSIIENLKKDVSEYRKVGAEMGAELSSLKKSNAALRGYNKALKKESDKKNDLLDIISTYNALPWYIKMFTFKLPIDLTNPKTIRL